jgi:hypothetical protein
MNPAGAFLRANENVVKGTNANENLEAVKCESSIGL